jgi:hypothetical protein
MHFTSPRFAHAPQVRFRCRDLDTNDDPHPLPIDAIPNPRARFSNAFSKDQPAHRGYDPDMRTNFLLAMLSLLLAPTLLLAQGRRTDSPEKLGLKKYESPYYIVYSDLSEDETREVVLRVTAMAEEYAARTSSFSGKLNQKFPFLIFRRERDYRTAGGMPGSGGMFDGERLMSIAGEKLTNETWHTIQHEGFHQFAFATINQNLQQWVNEGLAEYFGESVWTGSSMVSGMIPHGRMKRIQESIQENKFPPIQTMLDMTNAEWNARLKLEYYDMAWAMAHFLAHADGGKYQAAFTNYIRLLGRGKQQSDAFQEAFGPVGEFEELFEKYWLELPDNPTVDLYALTTTTTLTNYFARAVAQGQAIKDVDDLAAQIKAGTLKINPDDWLPPSLGERVVGDHEALTGLDYKFEIIQLGKTPATQVIRCTTPEGKTITGKFVLRGKRAGKITCDFDKTAGRKK